MSATVYIIDNYDSFVHNIARYFQQLGCHTIVKRNDVITLDDVIASQATHLVISPGPCSPNEAGISLDLVRDFYNKLPILGICLGHQAIGQVFGAKIAHAIEPMHGRHSYIQHDNHGIFAGIPSPMKVGRYHSLIVEKTGLSAECSITAWSEQGEIMALAHKYFPVFGVQFHPESILTEQGYKLLENFIQMKSVKPENRCKEMLVT